MASLDRFGDLSPEDWIALHAIGTGMVPAPPPVMFADEDPFARAAERTRAKYGTDVASPPERATPEQMLEAAGMLAPVPGADLVLAARRNATNRKGGQQLPLGWKREPDATQAYAQAPGAADREAIMQLQTDLKAKGYYVGPKAPIDGVMGPATIAAKEKFDAFERSREEAAQRAEALRVQGETASATAEAARAQAALARSQQAETERKAEEGRTKAQQREQGQAKLAQAENDVSPWRRALRDYSQPIGYVAGGLAGLGARALVVGGTNKLSANKAANAEALVANTAGGVTDRVGRINDFYRKGGAGADVPFVSAPASAKGYAVNPGVANMADLYKPAGAKWNTLQDVGAMGVFGAESAVGQFLVRPDAQEELRAAREAASKDLSDVNIARLQAAIDNASVADAMTNFGRGGAGGYLATSKFIKRNPSTPSMTGAETARLDLEKNLRTPPRAPRAKVESAPPTPSQTVAAAEEARKGQRRFTDQGESLGDILAPTRVTRDPRLMQPDM